MSLQILRKGENEMAKKEVKTDLWVARQLDDSKIKYDAQGSDVIIVCTTMLRKQCILQKLQFAPS